MLIGLLKGMDESGPMVWKPSPCDLAEASTDSHRNKHLAAKIVAIDDCAAPAALLDRRGDDHRPVPSMIGRPVAWCIISAN